MKLIHKYAKENTIYDGVLSGLVSIIQGIINIILSPFKCYVHLTYEWSKYSAKKRSQKKYVRY